jgi:hypothetical protein
LRYYGAYSARSRGKAAKRAPAQDNTIIGEPLEKRRISKTWAKLIKQIFEVDPLMCPKCGSALKIKSFIVDAHETRRVLKAINIPEYRAPPPITPPQQKLYFQAA